MLQHQIMRLETRKLDPTRSDIAAFGIVELTGSFVPLEKCVATIHRAVDFALNLIDTAPGYEDPPS
jgi:1-deoxyxylulose-5-phosphate synthase